MSENHLLKHETLNLKIDSISLLMILFHMLILFYSVSNIHEHTRISSDFLALLFWRPAIRKPHRECTLKAGAARRCSASGASCLYTCCRCFQKSKASPGTVKDESWYFARCWLLWLCADSAALEWTADTDSTVCCWTDILLARNLNCCNNTVEWILAEASILSWDGGWTIRGEAFAHSPG